MNTRRKIFVVSMLALCMRGVLAQGISVYHTNDLVKRLENENGLLVVNFWATWCKPCIEELPIFDTLAKENKNTKVLLVNLDFAEKKEEVQRFLAKKNISVECVLLDEVNGNAFIDPIAKDWSGAIPATLLKLSGHRKLLEKKMRLTTLKQELAEFSKETQR